MANDSVAPPESPLGIYRVQLDLIVVGMNADDALERIRFPGCWRSVDCMTIREPDGWVNPAWRVTDNGDGTMHVEPKRKRKRDA